jgi:hypothetical protein
MDPSHGRASQLATLKQGSPDYQSVHPEGRAAGVGSWETKISGIQMKSAEPSILYDLGFFIDKN